MVCMCVACVCVGHLYDVEQLLPLCVHVHKCMCVRVLVLFISHRLLAFLQYVSKRMCYVCCVCVCVCVLCVCVLCVCVCVCAVCVCVLLSLIHI